jgi:hypothetical protein
LYFLEIFWLIWKHAALMQGHTKVSYAAQLFCKNKKKTNKGKHIFPFDRPFVQA